MESYFDRIVVVALFVVISRPIGRQGQSVVCVNDAQRKWQERTEDKGERKRLLIRLTGIVY